MNCYITKKQLFIPCNLSKIDNEIYKYILYVNEGVNTFRMLKIYEKSRMLLFLLLKLKIESRVYVSHFLGFS